MATPQPDLIDGHVSPQVVNEAIGAIKKFVEKGQKAAEDTELWTPDDVAISLNVVHLARSMPKKGINPWVISLAHPLVDPRKSQICLIVQDPKSKAEDRLKEHNVKFIGKVISMKELSKEYRNDEDKRQLLRECSLFLADRNVSEDIPKRLGKAFYKARREPVYVTLDRADLKGHLERAISCTLMRPNRGNTMAIKIGNTGQKVEHIFENVSKVIPSVIGHVPERWENMNGLHLSINGLSLPIWSRAVGSEKTKAPPDVSAEESAESEELENSGAEAVVPESPKTAKKRKSENSENADQPPRKKSSTKGQKKVKKGKTSG